MNHVTAMGGVNLGLLFVSIVAIALLWVTFDRAREAEARVAEGDALLARGRELVREQTAALTQQAAALDGCRRAGLGAAEWIRETIPLLEAIAARPECVAVLPHVDPPPPVPSQQPPTPP